MIAALSTLAWSAPVRCDPVALAKGRDAMGSVDLDQLPALSVLALSEACSWPAPVQDALRRLGSGLPTADVQLAAAAPAPLLVACEGDASALASGRSAVYRACGVSFATEAEWEGARGFLVAPVLFGGWLGSLGVDPALARAYGRGLAGISDRAEDHPVRTFVPLYAE